MVSNFSQLQVLQREIANTKTENKKQNKELEKELSTVSQPAPVSDNLTFEILK